MSNQNNDFSDFLDALFERVKNPLIFSFSLFYLVFHFDALLYILLSDENYKERIQVFFDLLGHKKQLPTIANILLSAWQPFSLAVLFTLAWPFVNNGVKFCRAYGQVFLEQKTKEVLKDLPIPREQYEASINDKNQLQENIILLRKREDEHLERETRFRKEISNLKSEIKNSKNSSSKPDTVIPSPEDSNSIEIPTSISSTPISTMPYVNIPGFDDNKLFTDDRKNYIVPRNSGSSESLFTTDNSENSESLSVNIPTTSNWDSFLVKNNVDKDGFPIKPKTSSSTKNNEINEKELKEFIERNFEDYKDIAFKEFTEFCPDSGLQTVAYDWLEKFDIYNEKILKSDDYPPNAKINLKRIKKSSSSDANSILILITELVNYLLRNFFNDYIERNAPNNQSDDLKTSLERLADHFVESRLI